MEVNVSSEPQVEYVNEIVTANGKRRPVCQFCGRKGKAVAAEQPLSLWDTAHGWSCAPYPVEFVHDDGSKGTQWSCPKCSRRLDRGEALYSRRES